MSPLVLVPLVLVYAAADRFAGGGAPRLDAKLPGRAAFWGALVAALLGWFLLGRYGVLCAGAWLIWRTPAWDVFGGSMTPKTSGQIAGTFLRHFVLIVPLGALAAYFTDRDPLTGAAPFAAFAVFATLLAVWYGRAEAKAIRNGEPIGNQNVVVELLRGAAFGVAVVVADAFSGPLSPS